MQQQTIKTRKCEICGTEGSCKEIQSCYKKLLCNKHRNQIYKYGKITDPTKKSKTTLHVNKDNEIHVCENYAILVIYSKKLPDPIEVIIDIEDVPKISFRKWNILIQGKSINIFATVNNKNIKLSRFLLDYDGPLYVDHINRNTLDNRKKNLRIVTPAENAQNRTGGIRKAPSGRWTAKIKFYGKTYHIGTFNTKKEASKARKEYKQKLEKEKNELAKTYYDLNPERNIAPIITQTKVKWRASATINNQPIYIGIYDTKQQAIAARDETEAKKEK